MVQRSWQLSVVKHPYLSATTQWLVEPGYVNQWLVGWTGVTVISSTNTVRHALVKIDDDSTLASLLRRCGVIVEHAAPRAHETVGTAERFVRILKEHLAALRLELQSHKLDIKFSEHSIQSVLRYLSWSQNHFKRPNGGQKTAHEMLCGQQRTKPVSCPYGSLCFAETPDSVKGLNGLLSLYNNHELADGSPFFCTSSAIHTRVRFNLSIF